MLNQEAEAVAALTREVTVTAGAGVQGMLNFLCVLYLSFMTTLILECIVP